MDIVKKFIGLVLLIGCVATVMNGRHTMPTAAPNGYNVMFKEDAALTTKTAATLVLPAVTWEIEDYYLVKVAKVKNNPEHWVCTTIFSGGKWHR